MKKPQQNIRLSDTLGKVLNFADADLDNHEFEKALIKEIASGYSLEPDGIDGGSRIRAIHDRIEKTVQEANKELRSEDDFFARNKVITLSFSQCSQRVGWEPSVNPQSTFLEGSSYLYERLKCQNPKPS